MPRALLASLLAAGLLACSPRDECDPAALTQGLDRWDARQAENGGPIEDKQEVEAVLLRACPGAPEFFGALLKFNTAMSQGHLSLAQPLSDAAKAQIKAVHQAHCSVPDLTPHLGQLPAHQRAEEAQRVCDLPRPMQGPLIPIYLALRDRGIDQDLALRAVLAAFP